ncbi:protein-glutamate O-methyltransferase CheR [Ignavibacteriales bacterium]
MISFDSGLQHITQILAEKIGLDYATIGIKSVELAVKRRMSQLNIPDISGFLLLLQSNKEELQNFVEMIVVPETWFFRDLEPFLFLQEEVKTKFMAGTIRPLKILSIPSSTGEEPYSIAMAMLDIEFPSELLLIDAVDISQRAIDKAKAGVYGKSSFRGDDDSMIAKYFVRDDTSFTISDKIRSMVTFHRENLVSDLFLRNRSGYDIIFCRNLVIYLDSRSREVAVSNIKRLLKPDGLLFAGHTEVMFFSSAGFRAIPRAKSFALSIEEPGRPRVKSEFRNTNEAVLPKPVRQPLPAHPSRQHRTPLFATSRAEIITKEEERFDLGYIKELANRGEFSSARRKCEQLLFNDPANKDLICLMGEIDLATGLMDEAENNFLKVLYLEPNHLESLVYISLLYEKKGDKEKATIYKDRIKRLKERLK